MIYSVWNVNEKLFHYYEGNDVTTKTNTETPKHIPTSKSMLGVSVYDALWPLPKTSQLIGKGTQAKGHVASLEQNSNTAISWGAFAAIAIGSYLVLS